MDEVRRPDDDELCGFVDHHDGSWRALTVFGAVLGGHSSDAVARDAVVTDGLSLLTERWTLRRQR